VAGVDASGTHRTEGGSGFDGGFRVKGWELRVEASMFRV
jgi:hypothetical protein